MIASQEAKDFDPSLFTAVANHLALRLNEADAKLMALMAKERFTNKLHIILSAVPCSRGL